MTFAEIRAEVQARGYDYLPTSRVDLWIKQTYLWVCSLYPWPFLETTITGPAPLEISDLSQIIHISSGTKKLEGADQRDIFDKDPSLAQTGTATAWYLDNDEVKIWPVEDGAELRVRYIRKPANPVPNESPLLPQAYHEILVDGGVLRGLKDNDEYDAASSLQGVVDMAVEGMKDSILQRNYQNPTVMVQSRDVDDYDA
jgi:hypothetical protein